MRPKASSGSLMINMSAPKKSPSPRASFTGSSNNNNNNDRRLSNTLSTASTTPRQEQQEEPPFFSRPSSLLEDEPPFPKRPRVTLALPASKTHIYGLPIPSVPLGVCAECGLGGQDDPEVVLLCDGPACGREYHLKCCLPPLTQVPEGTFYCVDCSPTGTTSLLEQYLEEHYDRKQELDNPQDYVNMLLQEDVQEEGQADKYSKIRIPVSELHQVHKNSEQMIGHSLRLYCPLGNHYHNGRILDIRNEEDSPESNNTLCLVRFPAGPDHRKTSLTAWIHLEEHCVAVCTQLVWSHIGSKSGKRKVARTWMPAKLWSRTARELVPVATLLDESQDQIQFHQASSRGPVPPVWGLVETFGQDTYELLNLKTEIKETLEDEDMKNKSSSSSGANVNVNVNMDPLLLSLARAEWHELERVRQWKSLPLHNPVHPQAFRSRDEYGLGTLEYQDRPQPSSSTTGIELCPSIAQGLDRAYILQQLSTKFGVEASRDVAASLQCELIESVPDGIQAITTRDRTQESR